MAERESISPGDYRTLEETAAVLKAHGLALDGMIAASPDDCLGHRTGGEPIGKPGRRRRGDQGAGSTMKCSTEAGPRRRADLGQRRRDRLRAVGEIEVDQMYADSH